MIDFDHVTKHYGESAANAVRLRESMGCGVCEKVMKNAALLVVEFDDPPGRVGLGAICQECAREIIVEYHLPSAEPEK